ncbi:hypothetical protein SKAU_G00377830 [Synaphobranchus kaupii]|uniref:Immunoglobulin domain-containing protein n=1 Tax=Synaphobranchus kaupii TaxID=118154 RepID=A0A9Q1ED24_SYNKA|nr:hypothetical protein SKAU_G00377830 [Synaphobranchus kaupii]
MVRTDSPQRKGTASITDHPDQQVYTVTLENLQFGDSGWYWCAVEIGGSIDDGTSLHLTVPAGTQSLSVLNGSRVTGVEGDMVSILCRYGDGLRGKEKKWCRIREQSSCVTAGGGGVYQGRVRLDVDEGQGLLTVTLRGLVRADTDWYWCEVGVRQVPVHILISNASTRTTTTTTTTTTPMNINLTIITLLVTSGLLLLMVTVTIVSWKLWQRNKKTPLAERRDTSQSATPAETGDDVTYSSVVLQHRETGEQAPPSCVHHGDDVTYSSLALQ